jgi:hypothetical protein
LPATSGKRVSLASAASGSTAADRGSYSASTSAAASRAAWALSATMAATGTPTAWTCPTAMIGWGGIFMSGTVRLTGIGPR